MKISANTQLGLMMDDPNYQVEFLTVMKDDLNFKINILETGIHDVEKGITTIEAENDIISDLLNMDNMKQIDERITVRIGEYTKGTLVNNKDSTLYLICEGVDKCSKMVRIGDNFSSRALRNIKFGSHTYLIGKDEVVRFLVAPGAIKGIYWCRSKKIAFEFGFDLQDDGYYFHERYGEQFNKVARLMTFVELGDIEVITLEVGRNNGKAKSDGKITNGSHYTVYVVDSSWNQLIIRTEGFAVMGHFRLQPCGPALIDRKLIWIDAFEKHGYKRRPRAEIVHS